MYALHSARLPPHDVELSRQAAERYAVLTAVKERQALARRSGPPRRAAVIVGRPLAVHAGSSNPR